MDWFRWHDGSFTDTKFRYISAKAGVNVATVLAVWVGILERANAADQRGHCGGIDFESWDCHLGLDDGTSQRIYLAMQAKEMITPDHHVANWSKRQPKAEDTTAAQRKRAQRERERTTAEEESHDMSQTVTACHDRREENRKEEKQENLLPANTAPAAPRKPKTAAATATAQHTWFTRWWCYAFGQITGETYAYTKADAGIIKSLLTSPGFDQLLERACFYLLLPDDRRWPRGSPTLKGLSGSINQHAGCFTADIEHHARSAGLLPPLGESVKTFSPWQKKEAA